MQTDKTAENPTVSIVIPVRNESANINELYRRLEDVLGGLAISYEIVFVDDGSEDDTCGQVCKLIEQHRGRVRLVRLSRNFGHQAALRAGLDHALGKAIVTMDGDLQHPPEVIPQLLARWREGHQVVYTVRQDDRSAGWWWRTIIKVAYRVINFWSDLSIPPGAADFRLLDRQALEALKQMPDQQPTLRSQAVWIGFSSAAVNYVTAQRHAGQRQYNFRQFWNLLSGAIWGFSSRPLRAIFWAAAVLLVAGFAALVAGSSWWLWLTLLIAGVHLLALAIAGQYVGRAYQQCLSRPIYIVREKLGFDDRQE